MSNFLDYIENVVRILVERSLHQTLFKVHYALNLIITLLLSYLYITIGQSWVLLFFITSLIGLQLPLVKRILTKRSFSKSFNNMYFIHSIVVYLLLGIYSLIINIFYGDTLYGLLKLALFANSPTVYSMFCLLLLVQSVKYGDIDSDYSYGYESDSGDLVGDFDPEFDTEFDLDNEFKEEYYVDSE